MNWIPDSLKKEFQIKNVGLSYSRPIEFQRCQWQSAGPTVSVRYVLYRWGLASYLLLTLAACISNLGRRSDAEARPSKWPIYLTNWGYILCTVQAVLGATIVTRTFFIQRTRDPKKATSTTLTPILKLYWVLNTVAVVMAFAISGSFWVCIYDPARHELDTLTIIAHVGNSLAMGLDLLLVEHPLRLLHFPWSVSFPGAYFIFSFFYYLAGGTDRDGMPFVYRILDWRRPVRTSVVCVMALTYVASAHVTTWLIFLLRRRVSRACACSRTDADQVKAPMYTDRQTDVSVSLVDELK